MPASTREFFLSVKCTIIDIKKYKTIYRYTAILGEIKIAQEEVNLCLKTYGLFGGGLSFLLMVWDYSKVMVDCIILCFRPDTCRCLGFGWGPKPHWPAEICHHRGELWKYSSPASGIHGTAMVNNGVPQQMGIVSTRACRPSEIKTRGSERIWRQL